MLEEIKHSPDASSPSLLLALTFTIQTLTAAALLMGVSIETGNEEVHLINGFYSNILTYIAIRIASLFVFWFILFIIFWFVMYILGSRIEGFTVFSAAGYILSSQLIVFSVFLAIYLYAAQTLQGVKLMSITGTYPRFTAWIAHLYRLDAGSEKAGLPLSIILDLFEYFGTVWNAILTLLMFRVVGDLSWKRACAGAAVAIMISWILASVFKAAGML
ncbi:MAG: hypothetical protein NZ954_05095 [Thermofilaceae archaeon]|nr:hypothetical protein [Thermofilaceae archaeon]MCX8180183.1 hypothetical protein [Thermofilaceae archaeon]